MFYIHLCGIMQNMPIWRVFAETVIAHIKFSNRTHTQILLFQHLLNVHFLSHIHSINIYIATMHIIMRDHSVLSFRKLMTEAMHMKYDVK